MQRNGIIGAPKWSGFPKEPLTNQYAHTEGHRPDWGMARKSGKGTAMVSFAFIMILFIGILVAVTIYSSVSKRKKAKKKARLVDAVLLPALSLVFTDLRYSEIGHISYEVIKASKMVSGRSSISGGNHISGRYNGLHIQMSDITLTHIETRIRMDISGAPQTYTETVTDFRGQWVICDFNKTVASPLILRAGKRKHPGLFRTHAGSSSGIEMDNAIFNDSYTILTNNPHDAFYILTPPVMERIMLTNQGTGGHLSLEFLPQGEVHCAINSGHNFFEPQRIWLKMNYGRERNKILGEVRSITSLIDQLRLIDTSNSSV
jgi:hypothetical protein